jgi:hypothetical protein
MSALSGLRWLVVAVCLLGISACGSSSKTTTPSGSSTSSSPSSNQNIAADTAAAQAANLKLSDFLPGWTSKPPSADAGTAGIEKEFAKCLGLTQSHLSKAPASADSPDFSNSDNTVSSTVGYRATSAAQTAAFDILASPRAPDCMTKAVTKIINDAISNPSSGSTLPAGAKIEPVTVQQMSFPTFGDRTVAYQLKVPISYSGLSFALYLDEISVIKGRADVAMSFQAATSPFPTDQEQHYTGLVVGRLTNT